MKYKNPMTRRQSMKKLFKLKELMLKIILRIELTKKSLIKIIIIKSNELYFIFYI